MIKDNLSFKSHDGWLSKLKLGFSFKKGRSILTEYSHCGSFVVQKSFYPEDDKITPHLYLLYPPGGLVGGDKIRLEVYLNPGSQALLTTPSSSKFYRTNDKYVSQQYIFRLTNNATLEWMPASNIFFPKTKAKVSTIVYLEKGARLILCEMLCFGGPDNYLNIYNVPDEIDFFLNIRLFGSIGLRDRFKMNSLDYISTLGGFKISASLFAIPANELILKQVRNLIQLVKNVQIGGATLLDELLVIRLLSNDSQKSKELLHYIWSVIRPIIIGKKAVKPRIWFT